MIEWSRVFGFEANELIQDERGTVARAINLQTIYKKFSISEPMDQTEVGIKLQSLWHVLS